jgi:hypothetical protein
MTLSHHAIASILEMVGLIVVFVGSMVTAFAVILKPDEAIRIAGKINAMGWGVKIPTREEFLQQPSVDNLTRQSERAKRGLFLIAIGTVFQMIGVGVDSF